MKCKTAMTALGLLLIGVLIFTGCSPAGIITGTGPVVTRNFDYSDFTGVEISGAFEVEIAPSSSFSVSVTANENLFEYIDVSRTGSILSIGLKRAPLNIVDSTLEARVTLPELSRLEISGASSVTALGFNTTDDFYLIVSGASSLLLDVEAGNAEGEISGASHVSGIIMAPEVNVELSGASRLSLEGAAENATMYISGASDAGLADFPVRNGYFNLSGASRATVNVSGKLDADLSGASTLEYIGSPSLGEINISDACRIGSR